MRPTRSAAGTRQWRSIALALACLLPAAVAAEPARTPGVAVGVGLTTLGLGGEVSYRLSDYLNLRVAGYGLKAETSESFYDAGLEDREDGNLQLKFDSLSMGLIADVHPFGNGFRLSLGYFPYFRLAGTAVQSCVTGCDVGDFTVTGNDTSYLHDARWRKGVPYAGLGFTNVFNNRWPLYYKFELGAVMLRAAEARTVLRGGAAVVTPENDRPGASRAVASVSNDAALQQQAANDAAELKADLDDFKVYPVLGFWLGARFGGGPVEATAPAASGVAHAPSPIARRSTGYIAPETVTRIEQNRSPVPQLTASDSLSGPLDATMMPVTMLKDLPPGYRPVIYYAPENR